MDFPSRLRKCAAGLLTVAISGTLNIGVALADDVTNQIDLTVDADLENIDLLVGGSNATVTYDTIARNGDGDSGCNIDGLFQGVLFNVHTSDAGVATVFPAVIAFNFLGGSCNDQEPILVIPQGPGTATITLSQVLNTTGGSYNVAPAAFTVNVAQPTGTLTVIKVVINDDGGTKTVSDFPLFVGTGSVTSGNPEVLTVGNYVVSESGSLGYTATFSGDCDSAGNVTIGDGDNKTCTITNDDIAPQLIVVKDLRNDSEGGNATADEFTFTVSGSQVSNPKFAADPGGTALTLLPGAFNVSESGDPRYVTTYGNNCSGNISIGEVKTCIVVNDDLSPAEQAAREVQNRGENRSGASRGSDTNVGLSLVSFLAKNHGIGGYPAGGFGGTDETPLSADERRYICSVQTSLLARANRPEGYMLVIARGMSTMMGRSVSDILNWLEDESLCASFVAARTPRKLVAKAVYTIFPVDSEGMPVSSNTLWNACIRSSQITVAMVRSNPDIDEHNRPRTCADYHTGGSWRHPDFAGLYFTFDKDTKTVSVPDSYVQMQLREVI